MGCKKGGGAGGLSPRVPSLGLPCGTLHGPSEPHSIEPSHLQWPLWPHQNPHEREGTKGGKCLRMGEEYPEAVLAWHPVCLVPMDDEKRGQAEVRGGLMPPNLP